MSSRNSSTILALFASMIILFALSPSTSAQNQTSQQNSCSFKFETAVTSECFGSSGVDFTGVMYIFSGNTSGAIPKGHTYSTFIKLLCDPKSQDKIIPCVLGQMKKYNTSQCSPVDRNALFGRGGQLLAYLDGICGQRCEQEALQGLVQCMSVISMNPDRIFSRNASITDDKYSIIGRNESDYDNFCNNRQKLFSCLSPISSTCPSVLQRLYVIGIDLQAMETSSGFLCSDKQKYLKGITCFSTPSPEITSCSRNTTANMQAAFTGRYQTGTIPPSKYLDALCKTKIAQINCELPAYGKTCGADLTSLRTSVECTMLPKPCREAGLAEYNNLCQKVGTPPPVQTIRPTQGKPGSVPVDGGPRNFAIVRATESEAISTVPSMIFVLFTSVISLVWAHKFI